MAHSEKQRLKHLLVETIQVLCKNCLPDESSFCVEATIGITLSSDRAMVISFKEHVNADDSQASLVPTGEQDCERQRSNKTKCETPSYSPSSFSRHDNTVQQHSVSEGRTVSERTEFQQTHSNGGLTDQDIGLLENNNVIDSTVPSHVALSRSTNVSAANHFNAQVTDQHYTVTQAVDDLETDSTDDVVIFKVEEGGDIVAPVGDMQQFDFDTAVSAPTVQSASDITKRRRQRARCGGYVVPNCSGQPTSAYGVINNMQHIDGSHQQMPAFDESFDPAARQLGEDNFAAYAGNLRSQSRTLWSCSLCGAWLGSSRTLRNHVRKKHMALKTERCRLCGETFRWSGQVARHKRLCHPESL